MNMCPLCYINLGYYISHCLLCVVSAKISSTVKFDTYKNTHFLLTHFWPTHTDVLTVFSLIFPHHLNNLMPHCSHSGHVIPFSILSATLWNSQDPSSYASPPYESAYLLRKVIAFPSSWVTLHSKLSYHDEHVTEHYQTQNHTWPLNLPLLLT